MGDHQLATPVLNQQRADALKKAKEKAENDSDDDSDEGSQQDDDAGSSTVSIRAMVLGALTVEKIQQVKAAFMEPFLFRSVSGPRAKGGQNDQKNDP